MFQITLDEVLNIKVLVINEIYKFVDDNFFSFRVLNIQYEVWRVENKRTSSLFFAGYVGRIPT
jgi:hypothetical protein